MSCSDTVLVDCPGCGLTLHFQSKSGECMSREYTIYTVPPDVLYGVMNTSERCVNCKRAVTIARIKKPKFLVEMGP